MRTVERVFATFLAVTALTLLCMLLSACTVATYSDADGRDLLVIDARISGSAVDIEVTRPDGTVIRIDRDQKSPEGSIEAIGDAIQPLRGIP